MVDWHLCLMLLVYGDLPWKAFNARNEVVARGTIRDIYVASLERWWLGRMALMKGHTIKFVFYPSHGYYQGIQERRFTVQMEKTALLDRRVKQNIGKTERDRLLQIYPNVLARKVEKALDLAWQGRFDDAAKKYHDLVRRYPTYPDLWADYCRVAVARHDPRTAARVCKRAVDMFLAVGRTPDALDSVGALSSIESQESGELLGRVMESPTPPRMTRRLSFNRIAIP